MNGSHALVLKRKKLLLVKRRDYPLWVLPGGRIEKNESPQSALKREVLEETGFKVKIVKKVRTYVSNGGGKFHLYQCIVSSGKATLNAEAKDIQFFGFNDLPNPRDPRISIYLEGLKSPSQKLSMLPNMGSPSFLFSFAVQYPLLTVRFLLTKIGVHINT